MFLSTLIAFIVFLLFLLKLPAIRSDLLPTKVAFNQILNLHSHKWNLVAQICNQKKHRFAYG